MSRGVKVHDAITEWDGYALFDKDNVLGSPTIFYKLSEAERVADFQNLTVWNITLTKKGKVNDNSTEQIQSRI
jgi:hypothetical protein